MHLQEESVLKADEAHVTPQKSHSVSKPNRYRFFVIGLGFLALLLLPALDQGLGLSGAFKSTEKRILTPFPPFNYPHVRTFIHQFELYYKENFGWRNALFHQYSYWKYRIMGVSPLPDKVIVGKKGWFYPGNSVDRVVDQHQGLLPLSPDTVQAIGARLVQYQRQLAAQGARLYVLIAPNSHTIYPENLPNYLRTAPRVTDLSRLKYHLEQHTTVPLVDVRDALHRAKARHVVYCQTDSHWNNYGSLIATLTLTSRIRQDFPNLPAGRLSDYQIRPVQGQGGDLVTMLALNGQCRDSVNYRITPQPPLTATRWESRPNAEMNLPSDRFRGTNRCLPKLLLIGDSFSYTMNQFLPGYFGESYLIRSHRLNAAVVRAERPAVVVIEIVERNLPLLSQL